MDGIADEYDAAQERGEIDKAGNPIVSGGEQLASPADLGLSRKHIHNARIIRDPIKADPEVIPKTIERWQGERVGAEGVRQFRREISCRWR